MQVKPDADALRLQAALRDLVALSAIPAVWVGREPPAVAAGLADALVALLQVDFAFVRLSYPDGDETVELTRGSAWQRFPEWLEDHAASVPLPGRAVVADVGDESEPCRGIAMSIGVNGDDGLLAAASTRSDFPTTIERLLLSLAANHAVTAFQNACLIDERRKADDDVRAARDQLEANVAERTAKLQVANDELSALRRVATLVALGAPSSEIFSAVSDEVARLMGSGMAAVVRFEHDPPAIVVVGVGHNIPGIPIGARSQLDDGLASTQVYRTGLPARVDARDPASATGPLHEPGRRAGLTSTVASPISVEGRLWGTISISADEPLPRGTEERLARWSELLATAIANAESRDALARLADEQAALRRVAVLVARQPSPDEVFTAVTEAVGRLLGADLAAMHIFPGDGTATTIAGWSAAGPILPIGTRLPLDGESVAARIFRTGAAARMDSYVDVEGGTAEIARGLHLRSTVGAPILVDGSLWGALMAATRVVDPLPRDAETRIAAFTELVATAVSNAQAREGLHRLADEQAALRRVATLVAKEAPPAEVFAKVAEEASRSFGNIDCGLLRDEGDGTATMVAAWGASISARLPVGSRIPVDGDGVTASVLRDGRTHRIDDYAAAKGVLAEGAHEHGVRSAVGCPILVRGDVWGAIVVATSEKTPCLPDTEERLRSFSDLVATAVANADSRNELAASRKRIVAASDEARQRIERDLHDGTQQRLVSLGLAVRAAEASIPPDRSDLRAELSGVATGLADAVEELQELTRGIHPAILAQGGLGPALRTLARRSAIPVELEVTTDARLSEPIEVAAYYVASEALANAAKHARASRIDVALARRDGSLVLEIRDDGVGGADPSVGSGLVGLTDRVEALGGSIRVESPPGDGTRIGVVLPIEPDVRE